MSLQNSSPKRRRLFRLACKRIRNKSKPPFGGFSSVQRWDHTSAFGATATLRLNVRFRSPGLLRGLSDARLAAPLRRIHEAPARGWTIALLARETALSRSVFFERFSCAMGVPPMEYLLSALAKNFCAVEKAASPKSPSASGMALQPRLVLHSLDLSGSRPH
jgi:hypothetical protein